MGDGTRRLHTSMAHVDGTCRLHTSIAHVGTANHVDGTRRWHTSIAHVATANHVDGTRRLHTSIAHVAGLASAFTLGTSATQSLSAFVLADRYATTRDHTRTTIDDGERAT